MNTEFLNSPPVITEYGVFTASDTYNYGYVDGLPEGYNSNWLYYTIPQKSAREQVQDEILVKMAKAIEADDLKKAKQLVALAKTLKEL